MTVEELYKEYLSQLQDIYEAREALTIADWVFESVAGLRRTDRIMQKTVTPAAIVVQQLKDALAQLLRHVPVQYVLRESWFCKLKFFTDASVLIPRPETEELVQWVVEEVKSKNERLTIIDIGTGSGCIAIALKKELPAAHVTAVDISLPALNVAQKNAKALEASIKCLQLNFLEETEWRALPFFDIIVSNPPYIAQEEIQTLPANVVRHEPHLALFPAGDDHLIFYKKIALFAAGHLTDDGKAYVEIHEKHAAEVVQIFREHAFTTVVRKDMYGKERMVRAGKEV